MICLLSWLRSLQVFSGNGKAILEGEKRMFAACFHETENGRGVIPDLETD